jgi:hypothetical protein
MVLRVIAASLDRKRLSARVIHKDIVGTLGSILWGTAQSHATFVGDTSSFG